MAELRNAFKAKLISKLENLTEFLGEDFKFETIQKDDSNIIFSLKNKFINDIYFQFVLCIEKQTFKDEEKEYLGSHNEVKAYSFDITMNPGEFLTIDTVVCNGKEALYSEFGNWAERAWDEFKASSVIRRLEIHEENFEELNEQMKGLDEEYFSIEEAEKLKADLKKLKEILQEHIQSTEVEQEKKDTEIKKLKNDISLLESTLNTFSKKNWFSSFYNRFSPMRLDAEKRKKILQLGTKGVGRLIEAKTGDSTVKEFLDDIAK
ncbi:hypothetical protein HYH85_11315 [Clostridium botulinum]|uniref:hypothetical protein n=1 Tax=Clostridium botulinum TaxID=1491 RepID=UPI001C9BB4E6|nr:hypothetical protein [Clostridium botulinum]MBY6796842.1 hypothetical protein [Clostridium botulinum]MBY6866734.1 hypothetical protein [Clostridium botulinum]HDI3056374.1 hypothetical protein [Clostridium botulinum]